MLSFYIQKSRFIFLFLLGSLSALSLATGRAEAGWFGPRCKFECTNKKCSKDIEQRINCENNCAAKSIKGCLAAPLNLDTCRGLDYATEFVGRKIIERGKIRAELNSSKSKNLSESEVEEQKKRVSQLESEIASLNEKIYQCKKSESNSKAPPEKDLEDYISQPPVLLPEIQALVNRGKQSYAPNSSLAKARSEASRQQNSTGGGRGLSWIYDTFGKEESEILRKLETLPAPETWSIKHINNAYEQTIKNNPVKSAKKPRFIIVQGLGVNYLQEKPYGRGILQLASQFNYLESPGAYIVGVQQYLGDKTQGPQGSIEAAAASLHRLATAGKLKHALVDILPVDSGVYYKDGYLELDKIDDKVELENLHGIIRENIDQLRILPQWVMCEPSGALQLQVFSAAPSFQNRWNESFTARIPPDPNSPEGRICDLLVSTQYEAIGKLAVIQGLKNPGKAIYVNLTLVGQGVFNNPRSVMKTAFAKIAKVVAGYDNVHIYIHGFSQNDVKLIKESQDVELFDLSEEPSVGSRPPAAGGFLAQLTR